MDTDEPKVTIDGVDVYVVRFIFGERAGFPELYTLYLFDRNEDDESPLLDKEGRALFCRSVFEMTAIVELADTALDLSGDLPTDVRCTYDFDRVVKNTLRNHDSDRGTCDLMIFAMDFLKHTKLEYPEEDNRIIGDVYVRIFESRRNIAKAVGDSEYDLATILDAVWRVFTLIFVRGRIVGLE